jgi:hypothetical protein
MKEAIEGRSWNDQPAADAYCRHLSPSCGRLVGANPDTQQLRRLRHGEDLGLKVTHQ